ncbi:MAG: GntR family transcriptional regulator [Deltaproteobacteria bacterium]|nr:GntR family transcriptional regulator [Deltaproteobacteria bacterium]
MDELIRQKSLAEHIVDDLERKIVDRTLKPGQRIVEEGLCRTFGVSRSPVREAFQILESRGFVVREPRKGISVARITPQEAEDIYRIRASLDGLATSLAVRKRTPEFVAKLKKMHEQMIRAAEKKNATSYQNLNQKFHELIINASGNVRLVQLIRNFDRQTMRYRLTVMSGPGWMANSTKLHAAIVTAVEAGDADAAERIRKESILGQLERFPEIFKNGGKE